MTSEIAHAWRQRSLGIFNRKTQRFNRFEQDARPCSGHAPAAVYITTAFTKPSLHILQACIACPDQVMCRRLNEIGCVLPTEPTSALVTAGSLVAQHGAKALVMDDQMIQASYEGVKARVKQLYRKEPVVYIQALPATPAEFVRQYRDFALTVFSREEPPVSCPLNMMMVEAIRSRINMRGGKAGRSIALAMAGGPFT